VADSETVDLTALCEKWWASYQDSPVTGKDLLRLAKDFDLCEDILTSRSPGSAQTRFGHALRNMRDRVFGQFRIRHAGKSSRTGSRQYRLEICSGGTNKPTEPTEPPLSVPETHLGSSVTQINPRQTQVAYTGTIAVGSVDSGGYVVTAADDSKRDILEV